MRRLFGPLLAACESIKAMSAERNRGSEHCPQPLQHDHVPSDCSKLSRAIAKKHISELHKGKGRGSRLTVTERFETETEMLLLELHTASEALGHALTVLGHIARQLEVHATQARTHLRVNAHVGRDLVHNVVHVARLDAGVSGRGLRVAVHRISRKDDCGGVR
jgi:hypothetical protein